MQILNIAGYKFIPLDDLSSLRNWFLDQCEALALKGTILLSHEGLNLSLAGLEHAIQNFLTILNTDSRFAGMTFHQTFSISHSFKRLKVKLKKEIITLRKSEINPTSARAPSISPEQFKQWLDEKRDIVVLDTRNDYEIKFGSFANALNLHLSDFSEIPDAIDTVPRNKPIVMFCTGGIRCEKAALYMMNKGFADVQQLEGGILGYFSKVGGAHYSGDCFVFDERVALNSSLQETGTLQCQHCLGPIPKTTAACPSCV